MHCRQRKGSWLQTCFKLFKFEAKIFASKRFLLGCLSVLNISQTPLDGDYYVNYTHDVSSYYVVVFFNF